MNTTAYPTLKDLADIGAKAAQKLLTDGSGAMAIDMARNTSFANDRPIREAFVQAVLDAIGYTIPKDPEREAFEAWSAESPVSPAGIDPFEVWKAGREALRKSQLLDKTPAETTSEIPWIEWHGGDCPIPDTVKRWQFKTGGVGRCLSPLNKPSSYRWRHHQSFDDIIAYRIIEP